MENKYLHQIPKTDFDRNKEIIQPRFSIKIYLYFSVLNLNYKCNKPKTSIILNKWRDSILIFKILYKVMASSSKTTVTHAKQKYWGDLVIRPNLFPWPSPPN